MGFFFAIFEITRAMFVDHVPCKSDFGFCTNISGHLKFTKAFCSVALVIDE